MSGHWSLLLAAGLVAGSLAAQTPVSIGRVTGADFRLRGQVEFLPDGAALLMSGAQLEVRSGTARLAFSGGEARFCGPLRATVLKSAPAANPAAEETPLLFALDSGAIELDYQGAPAHVIQTPFFTVATLPTVPAEVRKLWVRVGPDGDACVAAVAGSVRIREQFGIAEMMIPPSRAMLIPTAGVEKAQMISAEACSCRGAPAPPVQKAVAEIQDPPATPATAPTGEKPAGETRTTIATAPLVFEASEAPPSGPPAKAEVTIPVVITANAPPPAPAETATASAAPTRPPGVQPATQPRRTGFGAKLKNFFRALFGLKKPVPRPKSQTFLGLGFEF